MTHVADDAVLGRFVRRLKGLIERAMAGSLDLEKLWNVIQGYIDGKLVGVEGLLDQTHHVVPLLATFKVDTAKPVIPSALLSKNWSVSSCVDLGDVVVRFEAGEMYIDGKLVVEYLHESQRCGHAPGVGLQRVLLKKRTLPEAILVTLVQEVRNPAVKAYIRKRGNNKLLFWGTQHKDTAGRTYVRSFDCSTCQSGYVWVGGGVDSAYPALVISD